MPQTLMDLNYMAQSTPARDPLGYLGCHWMFLHYKPQFWVQLDAIQNGLYSLFSRYAMLYHH